MKAGWSVRPLSEVCVFERGLTYAKTDEVEVSNNIVLRATNIDLRTNLVDLEELKYINDSVVASATKKVKKNSLLICTASGSKSHLGKVAFIDDDYDFAFGGFMGMLTPNESVLPRYFFHLMTSGAYKDFIAALSDGVNINNLKFSDLGQFSVPIPPHPEQHRIVAILDEAFDGIATAKANAEKNLQNARALFESQLQSIFTERGEGWVEKPLDQVTVIVNGFAFKSGDFSPTGATKCIKITNVGVREFVCDSGGGLPEEFSSKHSSVAIPAGSIVIALTRTIISSGLKVAVVPSNYEKALLNQRVAAILPRRGGISLPFLFACLSSQDVFNYVTERVNTLMQPNLSIADLRSMPIPMPSISQQEKITGLLLSLAEETQRLESIYQQKLAALADLKKSLLHRAFSGQL